MKTMKAEPHRIETTFGGFLFFVAVVVVVVVVVAVVVGSEGREKLVKRQKSSAIEITCSIRRSTAADERSADDAC